MKLLVRYWSLYLSVFLAAPTFLILVSWNALPGDSLYGLKTSVEAVPRAAIGNTKISADYEVAITDRRFAEATTLVDRNSTLGLMELQSQVKVAEEKVVMTGNVGARQKLIDSLTVYNQSLSKQKVVLVSSLAPNVALAQQPTTVTVLQNQTGQTAYPPRAQTDTSAANNTPQPSAPAKTPSETNPRTTADAAKSGDSNTRQTLLAIEDAQKEIQQTIEDLETKDNSGARNNTRSGTERSGKQRRN